MTDTQIRGRCLAVDRMAAIQRDASTERLIGAAKPFKDLPTRVVRRFSRLEKGVISCLLGLGDDLADTPVVLTSRYGPMNNTLNLLKAIVEGETMSPTAFSLSVHNAAIGVASQLAGNRGAHTAIAAGPDSFRCGLIECEGLLASGQEQVSLLYSDCGLPEEYAFFGEDAFELQMALLLKDGGTTPVAVRGERDDAAMVLEAMEQGVQGLQWIA